MTCDRLWKVLDGIQSQIRAYDAKAQILIAIDGIIAGFLGSNVGKIADAVKNGRSSLSSILVAAGALALIFLVVSLTHAVLTVQPHVRLNQPASSIFFLHIANGFESEYAKARDTLVGMTDVAHAEDLGNQILATSLICRTKAKRFDIALFSMCAALIAWVAMLVVQFVIEQQHTNPQFGNASCQEIHENIQVDGGWPTPSA